MASATELQRENDRLKREIAALDARHQQRERELVEQFQSRMKEVNRLHQEEMEQIRLEHKLLIERVFAKRSERYIEAPNQLKLDLQSGDEEFNVQVDDAVEGLIVATDEIREKAAVPRRKKKPKHGGENKFPEHFRKEVVDVDLSDQEKAALEYLGYDAVQKMHMKRPEFWVVETRYHKYVDPSRARSGVISTPREEKRELVKGDSYDTSVVAEIIGNRFGYHQPFYRLQDLFGASGWTPSRSTLANLQSSAAQLAEPFYRYLVDAVLSDAVVGTDDTGVKLLLPRALPGIDSDDPKSARAHAVLAAAKEAGRSHVNAKMWAYRGVDVPLNVFDFTVSRHRDGPDQFLIGANYQGTLLGDCYGANTGIEMRSGGDVVHAACNAHARRALKEALPTHERHGRFFLRCYLDLYDVEDRGATMEAGARLALRQQEARPIWDRMRDYVALQTHDLVPKEKMRVAINYLLNQWEGLTRYLDDPAIPFDNNESEQLMRQIALGRKNWLFVGSLKSGYEMSWLISIVSSAVRNHLHVAAYVKSVLDALLGGSTDYPSLRPDVWGAAHPEHRRKYRTAEREAKLKRKREQRAIRRLLKNSAG